MKDKDRRPKGKGTPPAATRNGQSRPLSGPKGRPSAPQQATRPSSSRPTPAARAEKAEAWPAASVEAAAPVAAVRIRTGEKPAERIPVILETTGARDYHLIDSGDGLKLEQYGAYRIVRPEAQALWPKALPVHVWENADAVFTGDTDEDGMGRWRFPQGDARRDLADADSRCRLFRALHVLPPCRGFPRAAGALELDEGAGSRLPGGRSKVLNLFGYTGVASLIAARAGAEVTHVDASKKAIGWARENQALGRGSKSCRSAGSARMR